MDLVALASEIQNDPAGKGYATYLPDSPGAVVDLLNLKTEAAVKSRSVTERGILASYGLGPTAGDAFMGKLDILAASGAGGTGPLKRMLKYLYGDSGIDIGENATREALDAFVGQSGITQEEVDAVKAMAVEPASRAEVLGLGAVTLSDVMRALGISEVAE